MKRFLTLITIAATLAAQAGIKKGTEEQRPEPDKAVELDKGAPEAGRMLEKLLNNLLGGGDRKLDAKMNSHFREMLEAHKPGTEAVSKATYLLRDAKKAGKPIAFATGVHASGFFLTKASEAKNAEQLQIGIGKEWLAAKVVRVWEEHDLAMLKADASEIAVADWSNAPSPEVGTFITAAAPAGQDPLAIGVVSVAVRSIQEKGRGFLGVQVDGDGKGILIGTVFENGAAAAAGVKRGDRVLELDGEKPASDLSFRTTLSSKHAGDKIRLKIQRGAETIEKEVVLGDRANSPIRLGGRGDKMNSMGSTLSKRSNEFPSVIQTDFPLDASKCGGPVTDLDGNVIGMVIARSGRIETLVLPSQVIVSVLKDVDFSK